MKAIRNIVDKIKPTFSKGGKLGFLHSTFDAFETFLFVPNTTTQHGAHIRDGITKDILMVGMGDTFDLWNPERRQKWLESDDGEEIDEETLLEELGM